MTIHDFLFNQVKKIVTEKLPSLNEKNNNDVVNKIIGVKGSPNITVLKRYVDENPNFKNELQSLISSRKKIINDVLFPIEDAIHEIKHQGTNEIWCVTIKNHPFWVKAFNGAFTYRSPAHPSVTGSGYFMKI